MQVTVKKSPLNENPEPGENRTRLIKPIIIGATFVGIATLSIITRGDGGGWPTPTVIAVRFGLLSACSLVYFWMLSRTKASRESDKPKAQTRKK